MSKKSNDNITLSELLGSSMAIAQHGIDLAVGGVFRRLKETERTKATKKAGNKWLRNTSDFTRGFIGFIGNAGDSYMETYTELKKGKKE